MKYESTKSKYCFRWGPTEAKSPAMFKDFTVCAEECAYYSKELDTCIFFAREMVKIKSIEKDLLM